MTSLTHDRSVRPEDRYTRLPDALLSVLTPREHQLVHALLSYRWTPDAAIYPYVTTLADQLAWSVRTVQRTMRGLEAKGYIVVEAQYRDSDKGQTSNIYRPGPMLLPLLTPIDAEPATSVQRPNHPPVSTPTDKRRNLNRENETRHHQGRYIQPPRSGSLLVSRYGPVPPRR